jgi:hypothetical protein
VPDRLLSYSSLLSWSEHGGRPARSNEADQYEHSSADDDPEIVFAHVARLGHLCLKVSFGECIMQKTGRSVNRGRQRAPDKDVGYGSAANERSVGGNA